MGLLRLAVVATVAWATWCAAPAVAQVPLLDTLSCDNVFATNGDYEAYGPTDVNAQAGNGRVTVGENPAGTLTVFKYPNPSFYNQVKYRTLGRDAAGRVMVQAPNEGMFLGVSYVADGKPGFAWLRDWPSSQGWDSSDLPVPVTRYRSPAALGLSVTVVDYADPGASTFEREVWVHRASGSVVDSASLVAYENFNPVANRLPLLPITDWCLSDLSDQQASYDAGTQSIVHGWKGLDIATGKSTSVAFAFGWNAAASGHEVGNDGRDPLPGLAVRPDAFDEVASAPYRLGGGDAASGQVTGALATPLAFDERGRAAARLTIAGGSDAGAAGQALSHARAESFATQLTAVRDDWRRWLHRTHLPRTRDKRVLEVAKRTLISVRLAIVPESAAIVASSDTQGPYGEDWVRDGAFINEVLDGNGYHDLVARHDRFYARVQTSTQNPSLLRPSGNWPMASYGDGIDGAPIPWEIDETGLGAWTLWHHATYLPPAARAGYLQTVYPAIARAADFLTSCVDPSNGLQCSANEDDNFTPSQTLRGAETTVLALRSALAAAAVLGDTTAHVARWRGRLDALTTATDALYDPRAQAYGEGSSAGNGYAAAYQDGAWALWPVRLHPPTDPRMVAEAGAVLGAVRSSLAAPRGEYESKAILALAHAWPRSRRTRRQAGALRGMLLDVAARLTTPTGLLGEAWERLAGGRTIPLEDMPHVWEHSLFYLASRAIYGSEPYRLDGEDFVTRACNARRAPSAAGTCPASR